MTGSTLRGDIGFGRLMICAAETPHRPCSARRIVVVQFLKESLLCQPRQTESAGRSLHFFVVDGRRWRRNDPRIPTLLRQQLVDDLMSARRAVGAAVDVAERREARRRVHGQRQQAMTPGNHLDHPLRSCGAFPFDRPLS
jgi:hypothetical protein